MNPQFTVHPIILANTSRDARCGISGCLTSGGTEHQGSTLSMVLLVRAPRVEDGTVTLNLSDSRDLGQLRIRIVRMCDSHLHALTPDEAYFYALGPELTPQDPRLMGDRPASQMAAFSPDQLRHLIDQGLSYDQLRPRTEEEQRTAQNRLARPRLKSSRGNDRRDHIEPPNGKER